MQAESLSLRGFRVGAIPILNHFIARMGLDEELSLALKNPGYADALLALLKNIVVDRNALYAVGEWIALYDAPLLARGKLGDDKIGRALDRLFAADRATLQTRIVLAVMRGFDLKMDQIHNDTTSVMLRGAYDTQHPKASSSDGEGGLFVTVVAKTRSEVGAFTNAVLAGDVRWEEILRKRAQRETFEIIAQHAAAEWITVDLTWDTVETFTAVTRGKPTADTNFRRTIQRVPRLHVGTNAANVAQSAAIDGIFPLTTNTKKKPVEVFQIYKYQPRIEKRHALLKSTLDVAPIWLKKNARIEALMFLEFIAQMVAALIERALRQSMAEKKVDLLCSLPEGRPSKTPTIEQVLRLFENQTKHALYDADRLIRQFADPLTPVQSQILHLLSIPTAAYEPAA